MTGKAIVRILRSDVTGCIVVIALMTCETRALRSGEFPSRMTGYTVDGTMSSKKLKRRFRMIKR